MVAVALFRRVPIRGTLSLRVVRIRRPCRRPFCSVRQPAQPRCISLQETSAWIEAKGLLRMLDSGRPGSTTRETLRTLISPASLTGDSKHDNAQRHRAGTLIAFDCLLWRRAVRNHRGGGILAAFRAGYLTVELKREIVRLFRTGLKHREINLHVPIGHHAIARISKQLRAAEWKQAQGRRIPADMKGQIVEAIRTMQRPGWSEITNRSIAREFLVSDEYVAALRRDLGDTEDRRFRRKLTDSDVRRANSMLREGHTWRSVAQAFHVALWTLQKVCPVTGRRGGRQPKRKKAAA